MGGTSGMGESIAATHYFELANALKLLGMVGDNQVTETVIPFLEHNSDEVRIYAASTLGRLGDTRSIQPLTQALTDDEKDVRTAACKAIVRIKILNTSSFSKKEPPT